MQYMDCIGEKTNKNGAKHPVFYCFLAKCNTKCNTEKFLWLNKALYRLYREFSNPSWRAKTRNRTTKGNPFQVRFSLHF